MLFVNNTLIYDINPSVKTVTDRTLTGMVSALLGLQEVKVLQIWLSRG